MPAPAQALLLQQLTGRLNSSQAEQKLPRTSRANAQTTQDPPSFMDALRRDLTANPRQERGGERVGDSRRDVQSDKKRGVAESRRSEGKAKPAQDRPDTAQKPREDYQATSRHMSESSATDGALEPRDTPAIDPNEPTEDDRFDAEADATAQTAEAQAESAPTTDDTVTPHATDALAQSDAESADAQVQVLAVKLAAAAKEHGPAQIEGGSADEPTGQAMTSKPRTSLLKRLAAQAQMRSGVVMGEHPPAASGSALAITSSTGSALQQETGDLPPPGEASPQFAEFATSAAADQAARRAQVHQRAAEGSSPNKHTGDSATTSTASLPEVHSQHAEALPQQDAPRLATKSPDSVFTLERAVGVNKQSAPTLGVPSRAGGSAAPTNEADAPAAVARGLSAAVLQKGGSLTLKLTPESLGQVRIDMTLDRGSVAVRLEATSVAAHDLLESSMAALRSTLEAKGLSVDRLTVQMAPGAHAAAAASTPSTAQNQPDAQQQHSSTSGQSSHHDAGQGASKGRDQRDPDQLWLFDDKTTDSDDSRAETFRLKLSAVA